MINSDEKICSGVKVQIGINIRKVRLEKELDVKKVCKDLELSQAAYGNIERGLTDISMSRINQLSRYFEVHVSVLLAVNNVANFNFRSNRVSSKQTDGLLVVIDHLLEEISFLRTQNDFLLKRDRKK